MLNTIAVILSIIVASVGLFITLKNLSHSRLKKSKERFEFAKQIISEFKNGNKLEAYIGLKAYLGSDIEIEEIEYLLNKNNDDLSFLFLNLKEIKKYLKFNKKEKKYKTKSKKEKIRLWPFIILYFLCTVPITLYFVFIGEILSMPGGIYYSRIFGIFVLWFVYVCVILLIEIKSRSLARRFYKKYKSNKK